MGDRRKPDFNMWASDDGDGLIRSIWNGTKMVVAATVAGVAVGLGVKAYESASE